MRIWNKLEVFAVTVALVGSCGLARAQVNPTPRAQKKAITTPRRPGPLILENQASAPQVVTILHRLTGLKLFRLLLRSGDVGAIARLDDRFKVNSEVHTNVIAGLALDDGQTIAAWLPEVEAETGPPPPPPPKPATPGHPVSSTTVTSPFPALGLTAFGNFPETPDVTIIARDGTRIKARYIGFDGVTGLSILRLPEKGLPQIRDASEASIKVGQHLRLLGPEPVPQPEASTSGTIYVRMGEVESTIANITRSPSGGIVRLKLQSAKLSAANIGGVALNNAGETVGIVDAVDENGATILPSAVVKSAVKRILERQSSVPRAWLGIRGEIVGASSLQQLVRNGWQTEKALSLSKQLRGILLTSVAPGSPAAIAALKPGDVILSVNNAELKKAEDLSWFMEEAKPGSSLSFTVARPDWVSPEAIQVKLTESPDLFFGLRTPETRAVQPTRLRSVPRAFFKYGIETIALRPGAASKFGADQGLLVVYVQPASVAFKSGLRTGDVIEAINGQQISVDAKPFELTDTPGSSHSFTIVRNKEKLVIQVSVPPE